MNFKITFTKQFLKDLKQIKLRNPRKINQINKIINQICENPFDSKLEYKKLQGRKEDEYRYKVGRKIRILIRIIIIPKEIKFVKIGKRENFY